MMFTYQIMFSLLVMTVLIIYTQQEEHDPAFVAKFDKISAECKQEIGIDADLVDKAWNEKRYPNDAKFKCYLKCVNVKLGLMNQNGEVVDDALRELAVHAVDISTRTEIVQKCGSIHETDPCETAMKLTACLKNATIE